MTLLSHVPLEGGGDFFNGMVHPFVDAAHGLSMVASGLWAGQRSEKASRFLLGGILGGALVGMIFIPMGNAAGWAILASIGIGGGATSARWRISENAMIPFGALLSIGILCQTRCEGATLLMTVGTTVSLLVTALLSAAFTRGMDAGKTWQIIAVRVAGSWLLAIALLMLALKI